MPSGIRAQLRLPVKVGCCGDLSSDICAAHTDSAGLLRPPQVLISWLYSSLYTDVTCVRPMPLLLLLLFACLHLWLLDRILS